MEPAFLCCRHRPDRVPGMVVLVMDAGAVAGQQLFLQPDLLPGIGDVNAGIVAMGSQMVHCGFVVLHEILAGPGRAVPPVSETRQDINPRPHGRV